jgi:hypothetical protein
MNIRKLLSIALALATLAMGAAPARAVPTNFVSSGDVFQYSTLTTDLWTHWTSAGLADFASNNGIWQDGASAFTNGAGPLSGHTYWAANTDLALQTTFNFNGTLNGNLNLNVASDNGFLVFLNGQLLAKDNAEGFTNYWEYSYSLNPSALVQGLNTLQILAEDHGGATFFDMALTGDVVAAVPEPGLLALLGLGFLGMFVARRNKNHSA